MVIAGQVREAYASQADRYLALVDGRWPDDEQDTALLDRHLARLAGPVLDLGCGPGHWTARLHDLGVDVTGIDIVPEFITNGRSRYREVAFRLASMTELDVPDGSPAGLLSWYSTIHVPPSQLDGVLAEFHRMLAPAGVLVLGFFDSETGLSSFEHAITTAYRWPIDILAERLSAAGFVEVERLQHHVPERPDRMYAAVVAHRV